MTAICTSPLPIMNTFAAEGELLDLLSCMHWKAKLAHAGSRAHKVRQSHAEVHI